MADGSCSPGTTLLTGNVIENNYGGHQDVVCQNETVIAINNIIREETISGLFGKKVYAINNTVDSTWHPFEIYAEHAAVYNNIFATGCYPDEYCDFLSVEGTKGVALFNNDFNHKTANVPHPIDPSNLNNVNPRFVDPANGNSRLKPGSPLINKGSNSAPKLPAIDFDGKPRIQGGTVDMGAFEAKGTVGPRAPTANGATGVPRTPTLTWTAGAGAVSHDAYFGTGSAPPKKATVTGTSYEPGRLEAKKKYYWKIVARTSAGSTTASPVWSFTTQ